MPEHNIFFNLQVLITEIKRKWKVRGTSQGADSDSAGSLFIGIPCIWGLQGSPPGLLLQLPRLLVITPLRLPILFLAQEGDLAAVPGPSLLESAACIRQAGSASTGKMRALGTNAAVQRSTLPQSTASDWLSNRFTKCLKHIYFVSSATLRRCH